MADDLLINYTIPQLVELYLGVEKEVEMAYNWLSDQREELERAFGKPRYWRPTFDVLATGHTSIESQKQHVIKHLRLSFWESVIDRSGLYKILSPSRLKDLRKYFNYHNRGTWNQSFNNIHLPETITVESVWEYIGGTFDSRQQIVQELFLEAWEYLTPGARAHWSNGAYKTNLKNSRYKLGPKVILTHVVRKCGRGEKSSWEIAEAYEHDADLSGVDKVFHLLDGKGVPDGMKTPLVDAINTMMTDEGETEYFSWKVYENGNLHLSYKRMDLVQDFNLLMGRDKFTLTDHIQL